MDAQNQRLRFGGEKSNDEDFPDEWVRVNSFECFKTTKNFIGRLFGKI